MKPIRIKVAYIGAVPEIHQRSNFQILESKFVDQKERTLHQFHMKIWILLEGSKPLFHHDAE